MSTVGLVLVSHSAKLAAGVLELAREMAGPDVGIALAGGLDLPGEPMGTDPMRVLQAIQAVYSEAGVLVLADLGSALLSTDMALEFLEPEQRARVRLADAPLVEGAVAAAVSARLGSSLEQVLAEARGALAAKIEQLGLATPAGPEVGGAEPGPAGSAGPADTSAVATASAIAAASAVAEASLQLSVPNRQGLHARPAARLVQTAGQFPGRVTVRNLTTGKGPVPATSINGIATLGARQGHRIEFQAWGPQAHAALAALRRLADADFGDVEGAPAPAAATAATPARPGSASPLPAGALAGVPASGGLALGPVRRGRAPRPAVPGHTCADPDAEWADLERAIARTREQIRETLAAVARRTDPQTAAIFEAHLLFLDDPALRQPAQELVYRDRLNAAAAWDRSSTAMAETYRALEDATLRARAADVLDVARQVIDQLLGGAGPGLGLDAPGILVVEDLAPADTARLDPTLVQAICTAAGGPTSHSAILARSFGIPAVVGLGQAVLALPEGACLMVDADQGWVLADPDPEQRAAFARRAEDQAHAAELARADRLAPAVTVDGRRIAIGANVGSLAEAQAALAAGAEGIGLLRSEFLYLDRRTAPDEEEQFQSYERIAAAMDGRPVIIRTLDIGGDKPLPYLDQGQEANPFLGVRALRLCLAQPELFKVQLRAILRAAVAHPVKIMFPMVATLQEFRAAKALLAEARAELQGRGQPVPGPLETGIMVEIPAAAVLADPLAAEADFFSIGTNDLTQYVMAAERGNPRLAALADALHPAVLTLIGQVAEAAHRHGKWVGLCGELGGDPLATAVLLGLGVDELSMSAPAIPGIKARVRTLDSADATRLARTALGLTLAAEVRAAAQGG